MAIDIVVRLRSDFPKKIDCKEAADEIDRLRSLLEEVGVSVNKPKVKKINLYERGSHYDFLSVYNSRQDMTSDEVATYLEIPIEHYGWWNYNSDLKTNGYIQWTGEKRKSRRGGTVEVYRITEKGINALLEVHANV